MPLRPPCPDFLLPLVSRSAGRAKLARKRRMTNRIGSGQGADRSLHVSFPPAAPDSSHERRRPCRSNFVPDFVPVPDDFRSPHATSHGSTMRERPQLTPTGSAVNRRVSGSSPLRGVEKPRNYGAFLWRRRCSRQLSTPPRTVEPRRVARRRGSSSSMRGGTALSWNRAHGPPSPGRTSRALPRRRSRSAPCVGAHATP